MQRAPAANRQAPEHKGAVSIVAATLSLRPQGVSGVTAGGRPPLPAAVARNGAHSPGAGPTGEARSSLEQQQTRRAALSHAGAKAGMHHLGSRCATPVRGLLVGTHKVCGHLLEWLTCPCARGDEPGRRVCG